MIATVLYKQLLPFVDEIHKYGRGRKKINVKQQQQQQKPHKTEEYQRTKGKDKVKPTWSASCSKVR